MMAEKSPDVQATEASTPVEDQPSGNWWDSWITSAKTKSAEVYSMVKKDLDEIGSAVKSEASHVFTTTSTALGKTLKLDEPESPANVMKKSLSSFIGQVSTVLNPEPDDEEDTEVILSSGDTTMLSTYKKELEGLQRVDATFLVPAYSPEFTAWRASLELSACEPLMSPASASKRLAASPTLRAMYQKLVPDAVTEDEFWERYLFRVALLQDRLAAAARRQPGDVTRDPGDVTRDPVLRHLPLQCATPVQQSPKKVLSGIELDAPLDAPLDEPLTTLEGPLDAPPAALVDVAWEDEDFANDLELTEEQQTLLLEEYEKEISIKKTKQTSPRDVANNNTKNKTGNTKNGSTTSNTKNKPGNTKPQTRDNNNKNGHSPKKAGKSDVCGNDLVEDYFGEKETKDDASANSDESWEKEFEIEDVK